jgi:DNA repair protein RadC
METNDTIYVPGLRLAQDPNLPRLNSDGPITSSRSASVFCRKFYFDDLMIFESMFLVLMARNNVPIGYVKISQGGVAGTYCDPKIIFKYALESVASGIIICHNHPSGNTTPSEADNALTKRIVEGAELFDIQVIDHIILTADAYYSYAESGKL